MQLEHDSKKTNQNKVLKVCNLHLGKPLLQLLHLYLQKKVQPLFYQNLLKYTDTLQAIEEGRRIADDPTIPGYEDAESLRSALETK